MWWYVSLSTLHSLVILLFYCQFEQKKYHRILIYYIIYSFVTNSIIKVFKTTATALFNFIVTNWNLVSFDLINFHLEIICYSLFLILCLVLTSYLTSFSRLDFLKILLLSLRENITCRKTNQILQFNQPCRTSNFRVYPKKFSFLFFQFYHVTKTKREHVLFKTRIDLIKSI